MIRFTSILLIHLVDSIASSAKVINRGEDEAQRCGCSEERTMLRGQDAQSKGRCPAERTIPIGEERKIYYSGVIKDTLRITPPARRQSPACKPPSRSDNRNCWIGLNTSWFRGKTFFTEFSTFQIPPVSLRLGHGHHRTPRHQATGHEPSAHSKISIC